MRCHFVFDKVSNKKVLIPGCYGSLYETDLSKCDCYQKSVNPTSNQIDKAEIKDLKMQIDYLQKQLNAHIRIIETLTPNSK